MPIYSVDKLRDEYQELWSKMYFTRGPLLELAANKIIKVKDKYETIANATGVPWYIIGLIHLRESDLDFSTHLHNGDPLSARTRHVPAGRPKTGSPPFTFTDSAIDALQYDGATKIEVWSIPQICFFMEKYNGFGYRAHSVNSPYLWAGTNNYHKGKYIADGIFDQYAEDSQLGVMGVLKCIIDKEKITIPDDSPNSSPKAVVPTPQPKELRQKSRKYWLAHILQWFGLAGTGGATATQFLDSSNITATKTYIDSIKSFAQDYGILIALSILLGAAILGLVIKRYIEEDIRDGRYEPSGDSK